MKRNSPKRETENHFFLNRKSLALNKIQNVGLSLDAGDDDDICTIGAELRS